MLAMFRTINASPGSKLRTCEGHTRESEQANTINCIHIGNKLAHPLSRIIKLTHYQNGGFKATFLYKTARTSESLVFLYQRQLYIDPQTTKVVGVYGLNSMTFSYPVKATNFGPL